MKKIIAALAILVMSALIVPAWADSETSQGGILTNNSSNQLSNLSEA